jgi:hypothetical protein
MAFAFLGSHSFAGGVSLDFEDFAGSVDIDLFYIVRADFCT